MDQTTAGRRILSSFLLFLLFAPLSVIAQLTANFYADNLGGCAPFTVNFTNQTTGASANAVYSWNFGNGNTSALKNPGAIFTEEKTYTITLTVTDGAQTSTKTQTITVYKKPTADFTVSAKKVCIPDAVTFTSTATAGDGNISSYQWDFGDGVAENSFGPGANHYYTYEQKPTVILTVTNSHGCYNTITKTEAVEILGRIQPQISADKDLICTLSDAVQFGNTSTGPGTLQYRWNFGDGTSSTQKTPSHLFAKKGVFPVTLTVSNTDGCSATSAPVTVNAAYFNTDFSNRLLCREALFTSSSYLYPNDSRWLYGDGNSTHATGSSIYTYPTAGSYEVTLINTYSHCKDTISKTIKIEDNVNFNSAIDIPALICKGYGNRFISKSSVTPSAIHWDFGDGNSGSYWQEMHHVYNAPGNYTIKLTNTFGTCKETVTKTVKVNDLPNPNGFVADYGGVCGSPVTIKFKDTTAGAVSWSWYLEYSSNVFSTQQNPSYRFQNDGTYYISLTVANAAGCTSSTSRHISVYKPNVSIYLQSSSSPRGYYDCDSLTVRFGTYTNQPLKKYTWNFGDGTTSSEETPEHQYKKEGSYAITLTYVTESGCSGTASFGVQVYGKPKADFRHAIPCGNSLTLQFTDQSYFSDDWKWMFPDGGYGYGSTTQYTFPDTGKYSVTFINHIGRCSDTVTREIYANVLPSSVAITRVEKTCDGTRGTVTFDQQSLRIQNGTWTFGDGKTIPYDTSNHAVKHTYTKSGTFQVTLTGTYNNCTLTASTTVSILLKQKPVLSGSKTEICSNEGINVQIKGMEINPYTGNREWGQYYVSKFEYNDGTAFSGGFYNYDWRYNNFATDLNNFSAGTTQLRAIISNGYDGCADTTNYINLKVNGPIAGFKVLTDGICYKSAFVFEDTSKIKTNTALRTWHWDFGDGKTQTLTKSSKVEHRYDMPGNYTVRLTVTDASGCVASFSYMISAKGPKAAFSASGLYVPNVPLNTTVTFYNNTINWYSNSVDYKWEYGDGATSANYYGEHTYTKAGTNTVKLIAKDASVNCSDTATQIINVKDFNTAFTFSTSYITGSTCPPALVRINNLSVGAVRVLWDFGDGTSSNDQFYPSHTYTRAGTYKITLYTYGYNGLTGTYKDSVTIRQPAATLAADILQGCTSQKVTLQAKATNTDAYFWDFGDGTISTGKDAFAAHQYRTAGIYQPRLIMKDESGCASSTQLADKIIIDSLSIAIKGIPPLICDSTQILFAPTVTSIAEQGGYPLTYHWNFGTGNAGDISNARNPQFNYNKPGSYTVSFKVSSPFGCTREVSEKVVVTKKAKAGIAGPLSVCEGGVATFTGTASMNPVTWAWDFKNGNTSATQNPGSQLYQKPDNYDVRLIVTYNGCTDTAIHKLTVHPNPAVTISAGKKLLCLGESTLLTAAGGTMYAWTPAATLSNAAIAAPTASPLKNTVYTVDVTNQFGCAKKDSIAIVVAQPFKIATLKDVSVCSGSSVQLNVQGAASYKWINYTTGLSNASAANPFAAPAANSVYTVVGYDAYNCFKDTATVNVTVNPLPTVVAEPDFEMLAAETHQLKATASADVVQWQWGPETYLNCTNCASPMVTPRVPMEYTVKVKNRFGCEASDKVSISLQCSENFVYIPNSFTPNNDGRNDFFYIKGKGIGVIKSLMIYSRWGEVIFERKNFDIDDVSAAWNGTIKGLPAPPGAYVYFAEMQCDGGNPIIKKGTVVLIR